MSSGEAFLREHDKKSEGSSLIWMNSSRDYRNLEVDKWILEQYGQPEYEEFLNFNRISSKKVLLYKAANSNRDSFVGFIASEGNHKSGRTFFEQWPWPDHQFNSSVNASWASGRSISVYRKESDPRFDISSEIFCSGVTGSLFEFSNSATGYKPLNV